MEVDEMMYVLQAYKEGKIIQYSAIENDECYWYDCNGRPNWDFSTFNYRVKPTKPFLRPFVSAEEVSEAIKEHGPYLVANHGRYRVCIVEFNNFNVWFHNSRVVSFKEVINDYKFDDGTPFGKFVEL